MAACTLLDFALALPKAGALLGLDLGQKRIGVALSDTTRLIATPQPRLEHIKFKQTWVALSALIDANAIGGLVIGLPRHMNGQEGAAAQAARAFGHEVLKRCALPLYFQDERLSSKGAERSLLQGDLSRAKRQAHIDSAAAAWILQTTLDALRQEGANMQAAP